jgi:hypothetical protein
LGNGEPADDAILYDRARASNFESFSDPLGHHGAVGGGRLRHGRRRHGLIDDALLHDFPQADLAIAERGVELVEANA